MEDLFDDDILLDDNDVTSVFGDTAVTSLSNLVNNNLNYLKFNYLKMLYSNLNQLKNLINYYHLI